MDPLGPENTGKVAAFSPRDAVLPQDTCVHLRSSSASMSVPALGLSAVMFSGKAESFPHSVSWETHNHLTSLMLFFFPFPRSQRGKKQNQNLNPKVFAESVLLSIYYPSFCDWGGHGWKGGQVLDPSWSLYSLTPFCPSATPIQREEDVHQVHLALKVNSLMNERSVGQRWGLCDTTPFRIAPL